MFLYLCVCLIASFLLLPSLYAHGAASIARHSGDVPQLHGHTNAANLSGRVYSFPNIRMSILGVLSFEFQRPCAQAIVHGHIIGITSVMSV